MSDPWLLRQVTAIERHLKFVDSRLAGIETYAKAIVVELRRIADALEAR